MNISEVPPEINEEAVEAAEEVLARLKSGEAVAFAYVLVLKGRIVATGYVKGLAGCYHTLNSGAARLAHRLASEDEDIE